MASGWYLGSAEKLGAKDLGNGVNKVVMLDPSDNLETNQYSHATRLHDELAYFSSDGTGPES